MKSKINKLRGRMGELGLTVGELERITGISDTALGNIIKGKSTPNLSTFITLCIGLKIGAKDLPEYLVNMFPELPFDFVGEDDNAGNVNNTASC